MSKIKILAGDLEAGTYDLPNDLFGRELIIRKQFSTQKLTWSKNWIALNCIQKKVLKGWPVHLAGAWLDLLFLDHSEQSAEC
ncbi:MAG TPA: hypothetical protein HPP94_08800 [Desulfuromonadales bacterium]|nr:hypothetical protein [Desulfuromonadales bacterium]